MKILFKILPCALYTVIVAVIVICTACAHDTATGSLMDKAEVLMYDNPDSSLVILRDIDTEELGNRRERARYALLMSMALDKNYIDTTTFDVIQPAIDYYYTNGTPDERLRTLYYQGRIYLNRNDFDNAMKLFLKAGDLDHSLTDTLTYANLLVAQGSMFYSSYQIDEYVANNLKAAHMYGALDNRRKQCRSYLRALDGAIIKEDRHCADSILNLIGALEADTPAGDDLLSKARLMYEVRFDSIGLTRGLLDSIASLPHIDDETKLDLSIGYLKLHEPWKAKSHFDRIDASGPIGSSIKYMSVKPDILESNGEYDEAFGALKQYMTVCEKYNSRIYSQKTTVARERHTAEVENLSRVRSKDRLIMLSFCALMLAVILCMIIYYKYHVGKINRIFSENERHRLQLENDNLQKEKSVLELKKHNAELECEKETVIAENFRLRISQLEDERERLNKVIERAEQPKPIADVIQERLNMLNCLYAALISDSESNFRQYDKLIHKIIEDKDSFMETTRLAFSETHPRFMKYLYDRGLDDTEVNFVCLYAIGLSGKEVGDYTKLKRHYHISSEIRKKLGLKENDTNLAIHIRKIMNM